MSANESKSHVQFDVDTAAEEERSARGQEHRKDLVRGIKWQKENEKTIRDVQMEGGYGWLRDMKDDSALLQHSLGLRMTVHGFLAFFHVATRQGDENLEKLEDLFKYFHATPIELEELGIKLKEHLVLIALQVFPKDYGLALDVENLEAEAEDPTEDAPVAKLVRSDTP